MRAQSRLPVPSLSSTVTSCTDAVPVGSPLLASNAFSFILVAPPGPGLKDPRRSSRAAGRPDGQQSESSRSTEPSPSSSLQLSQISTGGWVVVVVLASVVEVVDAGSEVVVVLSGTVLVVVLVPAIVVLVVVVVDVTVVLGAVVDVVLLDEVTSVLVVLGSVVVVVDVEEVTVVDVLDDVVLVDDVVEVDVGTMVVDVDVDDVVVEVEVDDGVVVVEVVVASVVVDVELDVDGVVVDVDDDEVDVLEDELLDEVVVVEVDVGSVLVEVEVDDVVVDVEVDDVVVEVVVGSVVVEVVVGSVVVDVEVDDVVVVAVVLVVDVAAGVLTPNAIVNARVSPGASVTVAHWNPAVTSPGPAGSPLLSKFVRVPLLSCAATSVPLSNGRTRNAEAPRPTYSAESRPSRTKIASLALSSVAKSLFGLLISMSVIWNRSIASGVRFRFVMATVSVRRPDGPPTSTTSIVCCAEKPRPSTSFQVRVAWLPA